ncbi:hypothetical protein [Pleionea sediminis]|uniref:hypothetical protein n=1 Tax=Pleionea sediminis TaxID=2569479 RepID=UPI001186ECCA|nr:hypothetical protein [Pleionea sediminis]
MTKYQTDSANRTVDQNIDFRELCVDGNWIHMSDGDLTIDVYFSNFFWRTFVFVNGKKISKKMTLTNHPFTYLGEKYEIKFRWTGMVDGICQLIKNKQLIDSNQFRLYDENDKLAKRDFQYTAAIHALLGFSILGISVFVQSLISTFLLN